MTDITITPHGEIVGGNAMSTGDLLYIVCKAVFGADVNGNVTIVADVNAGPDGLTTPSILQAARTLEAAAAPVLA
jgi:hypothetical protein